MTNSNRRFGMNRRSLIKTALAGSVIGSTGIGNVAATNDSELEKQYYATQGDKKLPITPIQGDVEVGEFFGNKTNSGHQPNTPLGIEKSETASIFLYQGPKETLSLVTVVDKRNDSSGGSMEFEYTNLPSDASWSVQTLSDTTDYSDPASVAWSWDGSEAAGGVITPFEITSEGVALEKNLKIQPDGRGDKIPLSNPWHFFQRYDEPLEGFEGPLYIAVLADNANFGNSPPQGQPKRSFNIEGDRVVPDTSNANEPTNDIFFVVKPYDDKTVLKFITESAGFSNRIWFNDEVIIENTNNASRGQEFVFEAPDSAVKVSQSIGSGVSNFQAISDDGFGGIRRVDLNETKPVRLTAEQKAPTAVDLQPLIDSKSRLIGNIQRGAGNVLSRYDSQRSPSSVDLAAQRYLADIQPNVGDFAPQKAGQHAEALRRLNTAEQLTKLGIDIFDYPVGLDQKNAAKHTAEASSRAFVSLAAGKMLEKVGDITSAATTATTRQIVLSQTYEDFILGLNRHADSMFAGLSFGDEAYQSTYRTVVRDELRFAEDFESGSWTTIFLGGIRQSGQLPGIEDGSALAEANIFNQIERVREGIADTIEAELYQTALFRDDGIPNQMPVNIGGESVDLPDLPDSIPVPYSDEVEDAANTVTEWVEDASDNLDEIEELDSFNIGNLEGIDVDLPTEIDLPDSWNLPDRFAIDEIELDPGRVINQLDELLPVYYAGFDSELTEEIQILRDKVVEGELRKQPGEVRDDLLSAFEDAFVALGNAMDVLFGGYDVLHDIGSAVEQVAVTIALILVGVMAILSLFSLGASFLAVPLLAVLLEIISLVNASIAAVEGLTGMAFITYLGKLHSGSVTTLLNTPLRNVSLDGGI